MLRARPMGWLQEPSSGCSLFIMEGSLFCEYYGEERYGEAGGRPFYRISDSDLGLFSVK